MNEPAAIVEFVFRNESGRIIAGLIRQAGSFDRAEEALQDAFTAALANWQSNGVPDNPAAWITAAAHRKLIDYARRERTRQSKNDELVHYGESSYEAAGVGMTHDAGDRTGVSPFGGDSRTAPDARQAQDSASPHTVRSSSCGAPAGTSFGGSIGAVSHLQ